MAVTISMKLKLRAGAVPSQIVTLLGTMFGHIDTLRPIISNRKIPREARNGRHVCRFWSERNSTKNRMPLSKRSGLWRYWRRRETWRNSPQWLEH